jgi:hypothetical protein
VNATRWHATDQRLRFERRRQASSEVFAITADIKSYSHAGHSFANDIPNQPLMRIT